MNTQQNLDRLAQSYRLGAIVSAYKMAGDLPMHRLVIGLTIVALLIFSSTGRISISAPLGFVVFGSIVIAIASMYPIAANDLHVKLYEQGFVYANCKEARYLYEILWKSSRKTTKVVKYDEITAIWQNVTRHYKAGINVRTTYLYTIQAKNGTKLKFDNSIGNVEQLGNYLQTEVSNRQLPQAIATYERGGKINFEPLGVSKKGLSSQKGTLQWAQIKSIKIEKGWIYINKRNGGLFAWTKVAVSAIPNLYVFLTILDRVGVKTT